ncbi:DNA-processing protein DprA [Eubacterium multiforme]|uniref:DNA processing protein n=1 Tax=Eubacterium multiforme TaxID=83339 RepID=A0ABT9US03_9FIRM|nr:DNA-processing protein DprA [Eubacterium multiforme]MDQ0148934.1 DNA processing protein [Eubacterium multiforme]
MEKYILWLIMLECTNLQKIKLLNIFSDEKEIFDNFEEIVELYFKNYKNFANYDKIKEMNKILSNMEILRRKEEVNFITIKDPMYPESLKRIEEPPYVLFYKGNLKLLNKRSVSIVGSRKNSLYGERATRIITKELVKNDICIVSGGAKGIDTIAHDEALKNHGNTIAVLGSGIDVCYPQRNRGLFNEISKEGLLISEFFPGTKPYAYNFPRRNRIISGLSESIIVTEATEKSGSLITVSCALAQGKDVLVVPQSIFSEGGLGANLLIRDGAFIYTSIEDVYLLLHIDKSKVKKKSIEIVNNNILKIIKNEPVHIDDIFVKSQVDRNTLYGLLFELQIKNEILSLPGNYYVRIT